MTIGMPLEKMALIITSLHAAQRKHVEGEGLRNHPARLNDDFP
jgi:hypothetical protein